MKLKVLYIISGVAILVAVAAIIVMFKQQENLRKQQELTNSLTQATTNKIDNEIKFNESDKEDKKDTVKLPNVTFPGFSSTLNVAKGSGIYLKNENTSLYYIRYSITDKDGKSIFETDYIAPNDSVTFVPSKHISDSNSIIYINGLAFTKESDGSYTQHSVGTSQEIVLNITDN